MRKRFARKSLGLHRRVTVSAALMLDLFPGEGTRTCICRDACYWVSIAHRVHPRKYAEFGIDEGHLSNGTPQRRIGKSTGESPNGKGENNITHPYRRDLFDIDHNQLTDAARDRSDRHPSQKLTDERSGGRDTPRTRFVDGRALVITSVVRQATAWWAVRIALG